MTKREIEVLDASVSTKNRSLPSPGKKGKGGALILPAVITEDGERAQDRFIEFFTARIRNKNTRYAYARAARQFLSWCEDRGVALKAIKPVVVASYVEWLESRDEPAALSKQSVKQHLAAIRMLFDYLVTGHVMETNPASSVRGPKYSIRKGKTPVLSAGDTRKLLDGIDTSHVVGLRDRALIAVMVYSFARVGAVVGMRVSDYYQNGKRYWLRLHEKGGKFHEVPAHHTAEQYLDEYINAAGIADHQKGPLFRTAAGRTKKLTDKVMSRRDVHKMIKRRARDAGVSPRISPHTFRATGITTYLENGGTIENAQQIAAHESPRTTKLYDRTNDAISLDEIERIII